MLHHRSHLLRGCFLISDLLVTAFAWLTAYYVRFESGWFRPRAGANQAYIEIRLRGDAESRDAALSSLVNAGIDASAKQADLVTFNIKIKGFEEHAAAIGDVLKRAEEAAARSPSSNVVLA